MVLTCLALVSVSAFVTEAGAATLLPDGAARVRALAEESAARCGVSAAFEVATQGHVVRLEGTTPSGGELILSVVPPTTVVYPEAHGERLAPGVGGSCEPACAADERAALERFARTLAVARDQGASEIWQVASDAGRLPGREPPPLRWWATVCVIAVAFGAGAWSFRGWRPSLRRDGPIVALLLLIAAIAALLPAWEPLHDHNAFVRRSDCAERLSCDDIVPWGPTTYHAYGLFFLPLRYGLVARGLVSLALSLTAALGLAGLLRTGFRLHGRAAMGQWAAIGTLAILLAQPAFFRLSVAGTFYPYVVTVFAWSAWMYLRYLGSGSRAALLCASLCGGLAVPAMAPLFPLVVLFVVLPLTWRGMRPPRLAPRWQRLALGGVGVLVPLAYASLGVRQFRESLEGSHGLVRAGGDTLEYAVLPLLRNLTPLLPQVTPLAIGLLFFVGAAVLLRRWRLAAVTLFGIGFIFDVFLSGQSELYAGYPTRFVHGLPAMFGVATIAGAAFGLLALLPRSWRTGSFLGVLVAIGLSVPYATASLELYEYERVLGAEVAALSEIVPDLPSHNQLIAPPSLTIPADAFGEPIPRDGDPVEAMFPVGDYATEMGRRDEEVYSPRSLRSFLLLGPEPDRNPIFYLGSNLLTWHQSELESGSVPDMTVERPIMRALRRRFELVPLRTFQVPANEHPATLMRPAADREERIELGFYALEPRILDTCPPLETP